jgi:hypothetical protein
MKLEHKHHYLMTGVPMGVILALEWLMGALRSENLIPDGRDVLNRVYWTNKAVFATDGYRLHVLNTRGILNGATARIEHGWYDMDIKRETNEVMLTRYEPGDTKTIDFAGTIKRALAAPPQRGVAVLDSLYAWQAVTRFDRAVKVYVPGGGAPVSVSGTIHNIDALAVIMPMAGGVMRDAEED